jgi:ElaB/YqjD/DUF883 family membrane-anchored ribosome-binding protein
MATRNYEQELDLVKADLSALRDDIKGLVMSVSLDARDRIGTVADKAKKYGKQGAVVAEHQITEHPFASVAVAFGAGLVLGRLLNGK